MDISIHLFYSRDPEIHERALAFDDTSLQARDAMDLNERSFDDMLEQREETTGIELEERDFEDELEERSFEDGVELEERGLENAVELNARDPFAVFDTIKGWFKKKGEDDDLS